MCAEKNFWCLGRAFLFVFWRLFLVLFVFEALFGVRLYVGSRGV